MAFTFAVGSAPAQGAPCDPKSADVWRRVVSPDGLVAVKVPCDANRISVKQNRDLAVVVCNSKHADFVLMKGKIPQGKYLSANFDDLLSRWRTALERDKSEHSLETVSVGNSRGFVTEASNRDNVSSLRVVELAPENILLLLARKEPVMSMTPVEQAEASACVRTFTESLEFLTQ